MNKFKRLIYSLWFICISLLLLKIGFILDFIVYRVQIQKMRADKIESFLAKKYQGDYDAGPSH